MAPAFVQATSVTNVTGVGTFTCAFGSNVGAGNTLMFFFAFDANDLTPNTAPPAANITDTRGNTYSRIFLENNSGTNLAGVVVYAADNPNAGANTISFNNATGANTGARGGCVGLEYTGLQAVATMVDQSVFAQATSGTSITTPVAATRQASEVLVAFCCAIAAGASTFVAGAGYTIEVQGATAVSGSLAVEDQSVGTTGPFTASISGIASGSYITLALLTLKAKVSPPNIVVLNKVLVPGSATGTTSSPIDTTGANALFFAASFYNGAGGGVVVSDSFGNTWTQLTPSVNTGSSTTTLFYSLNPTVGAGHTFTTVGTGVTGAVLACSGVAAHDTDSPNTSNSGSTTFQTNSLTPAKNDEIILTAISALGTSNGLSWNSIDTSFAVAEAAAFTSGLGYATSFAYLIQRAGAAVQPTWSATGTMDFMAGLIASFTAITVHSISGSAGAAGATVTYTGTASGSVIADSLGNYSITGLADGSYTLTPSLSGGYTFTPASSNVNVSGSNVTGVNFTITTPDTYTLVAHDTFHQANGPLNPANWTVVPFGGLQALETVSNLATQSSAAECADWWTGVIWGSTYQYVQVTLNTATDILAIFANTQSNVTGPQVEILGGTNQLRLDATDLTVLGTVTLGGAFQTGDIVRLENSAGLLRMFYNGTLLLYVNDSPGPTSGGKPTLDLAALVPSSILVSDFQAGIINGVLPPQTVGGQELDFGLDFMF
jgi:hypothetical protein